VSKASYDIHLQPCFDLAFPDADRLDFDVSSRKLAMAHPPDKQRFETWSKAGCSNSDYSFVRTLCCGTICVEDNELHEMYYDPNDPEKNLSLWTEGLSCPICGNADWEISDTLGELDGAEKEAWPAFIQ